MKKYRDLSSKDKFKARLLTKIQEYSVKLTNLSNSRKITEVLDKIFDKASKAHFTLFTGKSIDALVIALPHILWEDRIRFAEGYIRPFTNRNAAICLRQTGVKYTKYAIKGAGLLMFVKMVLNMTQIEAEEFLLEAMENMKNGNGTAP